MFVIHVQTIMHTYNIIIGATFENITVTIMRRNRYKYQVTWVLNEVIIHYYYYYYINIIILLLLITVIASPYVGMTRKQDGRSNQCISIYTAILPLGNI